MSAISKPSLRSDFFLAASYEVMVDDGYSTLNIGAVSSDTSTSSEVLREGGGDKSSAGTFPPLDGVILDVVSDNALDTEITIKISGLDTDFNLHSEEVVIDGTNIVSTTTKFTRVNQCAVRGLKGTLGVISIKNGVDIYNQIRPEAQISEQGIFSTPAGFASSIIAVNTFLTKGGGSAGKVTYQIFRRFIGNIEGVFQAQDTFGRIFITGNETSGTSSASFGNETPTGFVGPVDFVIEAQASASGIGSSSYLSVVLISLSAISRETK